MTARCSSAPRQRGAALLAAMLTVTLVATLAASALWQQWRDVEIETSERARVQAAWMLSGALDWSRLILREDARSVAANSVPTDNLSEPWAVPLQEARLSSFLAADQNNNSGSDGTDDDVFLSGAISDAQALFNLRDLVTGKNVRDDAWLAVLSRLFSQLNLPESEAQLIASGLSSALLGESADAPLMPERLSELAWFGVSAQTIQALAPYATMLPESGTTINLNTASAPVLAAVLNTSISVAQRLVNARTNTPFKSTAAAQAAAGVELAMTSGQVDVSTRYFEVRGRLRLQQAVVEEHSLVRRDSNNGLNPVLSVIWRERAALGLQDLPVAAR
jgi:general secretion pathway protein K